MLFKNYCKVKESFSTKSFNPRSNNNAFTPPQLASLYNFPTGFDGTGQTIGIIELGGGYNISDITTYLNSLGINKTPDITSVSVDGAVNDPSDTSGANYEVVLDIEVIVSIVPGATIRVYFAPNSYQGFYNAISTAISDNCNIISISWGAPEIYWSNNQLNAYNSLFQTASNNNISIFCASGDNGSGDGESGNNVDFPSSSPYVVACGGTSLVASNNTITSETVWNNNSVSNATGGGVSSFFSKPSYQNNVSLMNQYSKRGVPDVSGNADPNTGYLVYLDGQTVQIGGTSAVSPLWSALTAIVNHQNSNTLGYLQPKLYSSNSNILSDITSGNNGAFTAQIGYDLCTGLGSPCSALFAYLSNQTPSLSPISSFSTNKSSGYFPLTIQFTDLSTNSPTSWNWNFGDGGTSNLRNPSYTFRNSGNFVVTLTVTNSFGSNSSQQTMTIQSKPVAPVSRFNALSVNFRDNSLNNPTSWNWNFGDGTSSSLQNPTHMYSKAGVYTVTLIVSNSAGRNITRQIISLH